MINNQSIMMYLFIVLAFWYIVIEFFKNNFKDWTKDFPIQWDALYIIIGLPTLIWFGYLLGQDDTTIQATVFGGYITMLVILFSPVILLMLIVFFRDALVWLWLPIKKKGKNVK